MFAIVPGGAIYPVRQNATKVVEGCLVPVYLVFYSLVLLFYFEEVGGGLEDGGVGVRGGGEGGDVHPVARCDQEGDGRGGG